jgi:predicted amidophosphoribosyltransferase
MNCPNCNNEINEHQKFCPNCGAKIEDVEEVK